MQIEREDLPNRQVKLTVTPDDERVQKEMKAAAKRISKRYDIQGFRRGKAPYRIIAQYFGEEAILEEALDTLSQSVYREALEAEEVEPFMMGALVDVATDPLVLTYRIPLRPDVDLGDYRSVRVPYEAPEVTEEMVESEL
ncbi:MAG: trigger factor family protein, partial [Anaerolineae bacterium]